MIVCNFHLNLRPAFKVIHIGVLLKLTQLSLIHLQFVVPTVFTLSGSFRNNRGSAGRLEHVDRPLETFVEAGSRSERFRLGRLVTVLALIDESLAAFVVQVIDELVITPIERLLSTH